MSGLPDHVNDIDDLDDLDLADTEGDAVEHFYDSAIAKAEGDLDGLVAARDVEGIAEEIALLRYQIRRSLETTEVDMKLLHAGVRLLIHALIAQHRLTRQQADHLGAAVANVIEEFVEATGLRL